MAIIAAIRRMAQVAVVAPAMCVVIGPPVQRVIVQSLETSLPQPLSPRGTLDSLFPDRTPVRVTLTADWQKVTAVASTYELESSTWFWQRMHFDDWDRVRSDVREAALDHMWRRYQHVVATPRQWDTMSAADWDLVPQPVRAMAFVQMMRYWNGHYHVGSAFDLPRRMVADTMSSIVMVESWFEHRAESTGHSGNRDVGLGQLSDWTRQRLRTLFEAGQIDFGPDHESQYYDPWQASRLVAIWFDLMITEHRGDLDAAIRAYHRGTPLARAGLGQDYLANVVRKRRTFMRGESRSPAWNYLMLRSAATGDVPDMGPDPKSAATVNLYDRAKPFDIEGR
jgi:hypothetical protein